MPMLIEPLTELRAIAGLPDDPALDRLHQMPCFTMVPPTLDGRDAGPPGVLWRFREPADPSLAERLPTPWGDPDAPLVYASFGSVTSTIPTFAPIYASLLEALADAPVRVLLTIGEGGDPAALTPFPANAHVDRWWPQAAVMPHTAAVIGHGGFGTTMLALAGGVPQVVVPLFAADQFVNGARIAAVGAGICLDGLLDAVPAVSGALHRVLDEPSYRDVSERLAAEIAGLPDVSAAIPLLESLAAANNPAPVCVRRSTANRSSG